MLGAALLPWYELMDKLASIPISVRIFFFHKPISKDHCSGLDFCTWLLLLIVSCFVTDKVVNNKGTICLRQSPSIIEPAQSAYVKA